MQSREENQLGSRQDAQRQALTTELFSVPRRFPWDERIVVRNDHIRPHRAILGIPQVVFPAELRFSSINGLMPDRARMDAKYCITRSRERNTENGVGKVAVF